VALRSKCGLVPVPSDGSMRPLFRELRSGGLVAVAVDRNTAGSGTVVPFFGAPALLVDSHVRLALRMGVPVIPVLGMRNTDYSVCVYVQPAIKLEVTGDHESDVRRGMERVVRVLEEYIVQHPEQWVMFQPVWKLPAEPLTS
jgi:Kdo2-lipid IVA lauroyltransferase/acyltransferase